MATTIQIKNSVVPGKVPSSSDLSLGELALNANSATPALYFKDNANNIIALQPGSGVEPSPNPPSGPAEGDLWYDTNANSLNYWNGSAWIELGQAGDSPVTSVNGEVGVVVLDAADVGAATTAQGVKADNALQPGEEAVQSVNSKIGTVVLGAADVGAATEAEGALAASAVQPGDNISELTNDSGFITSAEVPVESVNGKTGEVVLSASDVGALPDSTSLDFVPLGSWASIPELV